MGGAGVKVGLGVSVGSTRVLVGVTVGVLVGMEVGVSVGTSVGVSVRVGVGVSVGDGLGVSVGGDCVAAEVGGTDVGVDVGCEATGVEVGETELGVDESTLQPSNSDIANVRPTTRSKCILGYIPSPHIQILLVFPGKLCVSRAA